MGFLLTSKSIHERSGFDSSIDANRAIHFSCDEDKLDAMKSLLADPEGLDSWVDDGDDETTVPLRFRI